MGLSWGPLGTILRPRKAIGSEKAGRQTNTDLLQASERCGPLWGLLGRLLGHLKPSWGGVGASWRHVVGYLGPCWVILCDLGGRLELSEAILEPSWAILDAPIGREHPRPGPGEGVRGGVNPSPKGEREGWKRKRPKPPTPRGLVGFRSIVGGFSCGMLTAHVMVIKAVLQGRLFRRSGQTADS